jgi:hypothetical protein
VGEPGVVRVDQHVGDERDDLAGALAAAVAEGESEQAAELALGHGAEREQRLLGH